MQIKENCYIWASTPCAYPQSCQSLHFSHTKNIEVEEGSDQKVDMSSWGFNSLFASSDFYSLLITFANSVDQDQDRQNVGPDLDPNRLTL